ncbi:MAG: translocation and assembly module TamA, partial [Acetobacteraceae bacterium]|nr:translocation and assembly module TamA [Acetobacteraceae bacterium]
MRNKRTNTPAVAQRIALILFVLAGTVPTQPLHAADPQPYSVTLKPTGDSALDAALQGSSTMVSLQKSAPVAGFALAERARQDVARFETALHSFGYYKASVTTTIGGHSLDDPTLPAIIDQAPADPP